jgi:hypothetical protein
MGKKINTTIFERVVSVTYPYLGPASKRFVSRQVKNHLNKDPEELKAKDLTQLIDWFTQAMGHLSEDTKLVKKYAAELKVLANDK